MGKAIISSQELYSSSWLCHGFWCPKKDSLRTPSPSLELEQSSEHKHATPASSNLTCTTGIHLVQNSVGSALGIEEQHCQTRLWSEGKSLDFPHQQGNGIIEPGFWKSPSKTCLLVWHTALDANHRLWSPKWLLAPRSLVRNPLWGWPSHVSCTFLCSHVGSRKQILRLLLCKKKGIFTPSLTLNSYQGTHPLQSSSGKSSACWRWWQTSIIALRVGQDSTSIT